MSKEINVTGYCSGCNGDFNLSELKHLPETEAYLRNFDPNQPNTVRGNVDFNTLLCPSCYGERFGLSAVTKENK